MARLSHELRTPLQSIAGYIELLRSGAPEPLTPAQAYLVERMPIASRSSFTSWTI